MAKEYLIGDFLKRIKRPLVLKDNQDYNLVTIKMNHKGVVLRGKKKGFDIKSKMFEVKEGDFILSGIDARNGAFGIISKELEGAIVTNDFWYFEIDEKIISKRLFLELTATTWFDDICQKGSDGTTQRIRLQKDKFFNQKILLPEGDEQKELLKKVLTFKKGQMALNTEIQSQKHLLTQLKQSILQEAIQGKLTVDWRKQNPNTEPASKLLKRIKTEKAQLIKDKKIKKEKSLLPITKEEIPFELPEGWVWSKLGDICSKTGSGSTPRGGKSAYPDSGTPFIRSQNVYDDGIRLRGVAFIADTTHEKMKGTKVQAEDLLLNITGGSIGRCCIVPKEFETGNINQHVAIIRTVNTFNGYFIHKVVCSPYFQNMIFEVQTGAGREGLPKNKMDNILIAFPPLEEQKEIVKKVKALMQNCQALEQEIKTSEVNAQMLMQAVLKEAFEGEKEEQVATRDTLFESENHDIYVAMIIQQIENRLRINYGEVAMQKTVFNFNTFTPENIPYQFINSNYGTFSPQLKKDLQKNPYLTKTNKGHGDVFAIKTSKNKDVLDAMTTAQNKSFMVAINKVLDIYEMPFINKETDKIELLNTVTKCVLDIETNDLEKVYLAMQNWEIKQKGYKTKADKFSKSNTKKMLQLIDNLGLMKK